MKRYPKSIFYQLTGVLSLLVMCICCGNDEPGTDPTPEETQITIQSIADLNKRTQVIDSHKDEKNNGLELDFRRAKELSSELATTSPYYPRVKKISEGAYILFYQDHQTGDKSIYYALSKDLLSWSASRPLFTAYPHGNDTRKFATVDAVVLHNGDIIAVCSFRDNKGYSTRPQDSGLMLRRSSDGGKTWSEEEIIYIGSNWEPYPLQLPSGEIQIYFTDNDPTQGIHNSGSSIIRSYDNGMTWTPEKGKLPIRVCHQYTYTNDDGVKIFSGQMSVARLLHDNKTIAVVCEARLTYEGVYRISTYYSTNNWAKSIGQNEEGPDDHQWNMWSGSGPYLSLFPSGESVMSYGAKVGNERSNRGIILFGGPTTRDFDNTRPFYPFGNYALGFWGCSEIDNPHTLIVAWPNIVTSNTKSSIWLGRTILNHRINAPFIMPTIDGDNADWNNNTDAFFLGSDSRSQATFRMAHDNDKLYLLVERMDEYLTNDDAFTIMLNNGSNTLKFKINFDQITNTLITDNSAIECKSFISGTFNDGGRDKGFIAELAIPVAQLSHSQRMFFNAVLHDKEVNDGFENLKENEAAKWLPVVLDK
ncbi:MAG: exo-alpha-sialidase [Parabacteroides sp.]|nr:exo-alpha-sialidase [Parabacteroides sp.]